MYVCDLSLSCGCALVCVQLCLTCMWFDEFLTVESCSIQCFSF